MIDTVITLEDKWVCDRLHDEPATSYYFKWKEDQLKAFSFNIDRSYGDA